RLYVQLNTDCCFCQPRHRESNTKTVQETCRKRCCKQLATFQHAWVLPCQHNMRQGYSSRIIPLSILAKSLAGCYTRDLSLGAFGFDGFTLLSAGKTGMEDVIGSSSTPIPRSRPAVSGSKIVATKAPAAMTVK